MIYIIQTALELGCIYTLVALALFMSFRILNIADLTTDGSFVLGMAVSVSLTALGHPYLGVVLALISGAGAGYITAFLQTKMGIPSILAGIVTNTGLYTVNLAVMGWKSNLSLLKVDTIFTLIHLGKFSDILVAGLVMFICMILIRIFLATRLGLSLRATGDNQDMVSASSINPSFTITVGLMIANALTALSGGLAGQLNKASDINGGTGIVVIGLACLVIGETCIHGRKNLTRNIIACFVGNVIYRLLYAIILKTSFIPIACLKLMTAIVVALAIAAPTLKKKYEYMIQERRELR